MKSRQRLIRIAAIAGITGCIGDFVLLYLAATRVPGYDHLRDTMSKLGTTGSPVSDRISAWWAILGVLMILFGLGIRKAFTANRKASSLAGWLIILYGLGEGFGSGIFKADHVAGEMTTSAIIHNLFGAVGVIAIALFPLVMKKVLTEPSFRIFSNFIFIFGLIFLSLFMMRFILPAGSFIPVFKGLWQRLFVLNSYMYLLVTARFMIVMNRN